MIKSQFTFDLALWCTSVKQKQKKSAIKWIALF